MSELKIIKESVWEHQNVNGDIEIHTQNFRNLANFKFYPERLKDAPSEETKAFREACLSHSKLYLNAHNTYNKCPILPSELLEQRNEYKDAFIRLVEQIENEHVSPILEELVVEFEELINKQKL